MADSSEAELASPRSDASPHSDAGIGAPTPRTSTRKRAAVDYKDPGPLKMSEIRMEPRKRSKKKSAKKTAAPTFESSDDESRASSAYSRKPAARKPASHKPRSKRPRDDGDSSDGDASSASPRATDAGSKEAKKWKGLYEKLGKEHEAAEDAARADRKRAKKASEKLKEESALRRAAEERSGVFALLTGFRVEEADIEDDGREFDCVASSHFFDRELKFYLTIDPDDDLVYFEATEGADCLPERMRQPLTFDKDQFPRFVSRILACVHGPAKKDKKDAMTA